MDAPDQRIGFAIVGLGRLMANQLLPAFGKTTHCRLAALVSGDRGNAVRDAVEARVRLSELCPEPKHEA